jgi:hypothetical protein
MRALARAFSLVAIVGAFACDGSPSEDDLGPGPGGEATSETGGVGGSEGASDEAEGSSGEGEASEEESGAAACVGMDVCGVQCTDLLSDPDNCGACGVSCVIPHGEGGCAEGACLLAACEDGWGDCDGDAQNGCETASECVAGSDCQTSCGSTGHTSCADACAPVCVTVAETCNAVDDDCNGTCDEGPLASCRQGVHRSNSPTLGHFYTLDAAEAASGDLTVEALDFYFTYVEAIDGLVPLYRCLRPNGRRFYTQSAACENAGTPEGHLGYVSPDARCGAVELFRLYLGSQDRHFYTVSAAERDSAVASGWTYEFVAGWVWPGA